LFLRRRALQLEHHMVERQAVGNRPQIVFGRSLRACIARESHQLALIHTLANEPAAGGLRTCGLRQKRGNTAGQQNDHAQRDGTKPKCSTHKVNVIFLESRFNRPHGNRLRRYAASLTMVTGWTDRTGNRSTGKKTPQSGYPALYLPATPDASVLKFT